MINAKVPNYVPNEMISHGIRIYVYDRSSKNAEPIQWIQKSVVETSENIFTCKGSTKGPPMKIAQGEVGLILSGEISRQLMITELKSNE